MPVVPIIQFQVVTGTDGQVLELFALDMNGRLWVRSNDPESGKPVWSEVTGPDDSDPANRAWGRHD